MWVRGQGQKDIFKIDLPNEDRGFAQIRVLSVSNGWTHSNYPIYWKVISYFAK